MNLNQIHTAQVRAAEDAVIAGIPPELLATMDRANERLAAKGGCTGCGSKLVGVHYMPCAVASEPDCY